MKSRITNEAERARASETEHVVRPFARLDSFVTARQSPLRHESNAAEFTFAAYYFENIPDYRKFVKMSEIDWSNNAVIVLMQEYEKRPELWDKEHNLYRVQSSKIAAWTTIAQGFSCDVVDLRKKFNSLLASYRRERTKVKEGGKSTWFLYPHMRFLHGYIKSPDDGLDEMATENYEPAETVYETYEMPSDETNISEDLQEEEVLIKHEPEAQAFIHKRFINIANHGKKRLKRTLSRRARQHNIHTKVPEEMYTKAYVDSRILEMQRMIKNESLRKKDDCDTYGEYIASTLKKHDNKTQCMIKQAINNILFDQEMIKYETPLDNDMVTEILDPSDE